MKTLKITACMLLCFALLIGIFPHTAAFAVDECIDTSGTNVLANRYSYYFAVPMKSYLYPVNGGYMRFQAGVVSGAYLVQYFDADYKLLSKQTVAAELPIFGGFYSNGVNHFVLTGQRNMEESAEIECFRVTKYDLNWKKLSSAGLYDCNTYIPFDAGSARFAEANGSLIIRTSHEMYKTSDGYNHQSNYTLILDIESMAIAGVGNMAYSSHSFNQFVIASGNNYITVDHGDAYPRAISLVVTERQGYTLYTRKRVDLFTFKGDIGENYTGAAVGGLAESDSAYITAFCSIEQNDSYQSNKTRNVYVAVTDKSSYTTTLNQITAMAEGETTAEPPQLVKLSANSFLLIWQIGNTLYYCYLDGNGNKVGETKTFAGASMSDCQPIAVNGKVVWYSYTNNDLSFYEIGESDNKIKTLDTGHAYKVYEHNEATPEKCSFKCEKCGKIVEYTTPVSMRLAYSKDGSEYYYMRNSLTFKEGAGVPLYLWDINASGNNGVVTIQKDDIVIEMKAVYGSCTLVFPENGVYKVTYSYEKNPFISCWFTVSVGEHLPLGDVNGDGVADNQDACLILRYDAGLISGISNGDVNFDGKTDSVDAAIVLKYDAGLLNSII